MSKITIIILTYNEELHIERCIRSLQSTSSKIFVIDSYSTDRTVEIAENLNAKVVQRAFINQAEQFQWGLDNLSIDTHWIMRMDADEYVEPDLQEELAVLLENARENIDGIYLKRKVFFQNKWIRHGGFYPHTLLRIWRAGQGHIEQRWMDEHIVLPPGSKTIVANGHIVDDNQKGLTFWIDKHNKYASREAIDLLNLKYKFLPADESLKYLDDPQARQKRLIKEKLYSHLPYGFRSILYFMYRYFLKFGFLDGTKGFLWHFMQGFWYRLLVDMKIEEIETRSGRDIDRMKKILEKEHGLKV